MEFSIEKAKQGGTVRTRCGFAVQEIDYNNGIEDTPVTAVVMEVVTLRKGRKKKAFVEPCLTLYHADGRLHDGRDDGWDLVIVEEMP